MTLFCVKADLLQKAIYYYYLTFSVLIFEWREWNNGIKLNYYSNRDNKK